MDADKVSPQMRSFVEVSLIRRAGNRADHHADHRAVCAIRPDSKRR